MSGVREVVSPPRYRRREVRRDDVSVSRASADHCPGVSLAVDDDCPLHVAVSHGAVDPEWDDFVAKTRAGHHLQTSRWGQVKATVGWRAKRLIARRGGLIVGGCQVLMRRVPLVGSVAYVPRGPLTAEPGGALDAILAGLREL